MDPARGDLSDVDREIEELREVLQRHPPRIGALVSRFVVVQEWVFKDDSRDVIVTRSDGVFPWDEAGLLQFALDKSADEEDGDES